MATIAENLSRIQSAKADIKSAIEAKGVTVPSSATIDTYDDYISQISGGGGGIPMPSNLSAAILNDYGLLTSAAIKSGVTSIGNNAFYNCRSLTSVEIQNSVTSIGNSAFEYCTSLTSVTIPNSVTIIGSDAFRNCTILTSITIPNSVTSISNNAFRVCKSLSSVTIPNSVTNIGNGAFYNCTNLESITVNAATPPTLGSNAFYASNCPIYVPAESVNAYKSASIWSDYASRIQAIPT